MTVSKADFVSCQDKEGITYDCKKQDAFKEKHVEHDVERRCWINGHGR